MSSYSKETAEIILKNVPLLNEWLKDGNLRIDERGVWIEPFLDWEGNSILTTEESNTLQWSACCEVDGPDAPDPRTTPGLPIPFSERELAAFMIDGAGWFLQEVYGPLHGEPDGSVLQSFSIVEKKAKDAIIGAYAAFREAERTVRQAQPYLAEVGWAELLRLDYQKALDSASIAAGVFEPEISNGEREGRRQVALAAVTPSYESWRVVQQRAEQMESGWRHQMVNLLLRPSDELAAREPASLPNWHLNKPNRMNTLLGMIYKVLKAAHDSNEPRAPTAHDVMDAIAAANSPDFIELSSEGLKYFNSNGDPDTAAVESIRKRIERMTGARMDDNRTLRGR